MLQGWCEMFWCFRDWSRKSRTGTKRWKKKCWVSKTWEWNSPWWGTSPLWSLFCLKLFFFFISSYSILNILHLCLLHMVSYIWISVDACVQRTFESVLMHVCSVCYHRHTKGYKECWFLIRRYKNEGSLTLIQFSSHLVEVMIQSHFIHPTRAVPLRWDCEWNKQPKQVNNKCST